jgi:hypothetical protein
MVSKGTKIIKVSKSFKVRGLTTATQSLGQSCSDGQQTARHMSMVVVSLTLTATKESSLVEEGSMELLPSEPSSDDGISLQHVQQSPIFFAYCRCYLVKSQCYMNSESLPIH